MLTNSLPNVIAKMLIELYPGKLKQHELSQNPSLFEGAGAIQNILHKRNPTCVYTKDTKHQVAIVRGDTEEIRRSAEDLRPFQKTHRVIVIGDFGDASRGYTYSVYFVNTNSPNALQTSLTKVLRSTTAFWSSKKIEDEE